MYFFACTFYVRFLLDVAKKPESMFLPEGDHRIVYQRQGVQLKDGEPYVMTFKGAKMFGESFYFAFKPYDFFLEKGEKLKVKLKDQILEVVNDGSLCARQNNFLCELNALKIDYFIDRNVCSKPGRKPQWNVNNIGDTLNVRFERFKKTKS